MTAESRSDLFGSTPNASTQPDGHASSRYIDPGSTGATSDRPDTLTVAEPKPQPCAINTRSITCLAASIESGTFGASSKIIKPGTSQVGVHERRTSSASGIGSNQWSNYRQPVDPVRAGFLEGAT